MVSLSYAHETVISWLVLIFTAGIAVYWYLTKNYNYWKYLGIPYVKAVPFLGSMGNVMNTPCCEIEMERYRKKGRIYGTYEGRTPALTIGEPDILRHIFVKDFPVFMNRRSFKCGNPMADKALGNLESDEWKRMRTVLSSAFSTGKIKKMSSIFLESAQVLTENFKKVAKEGNAVDVKSYFGAFTMDVIASSAFSSKIDSHNDIGNPFVTNAKKIFGQEITWKAMPFIIFPPLMRLFKIPTIGLGRILQIPTFDLQFFMDTALKIIEERKHSGQKRNDFLQLMIDSTNEALQVDAVDSEENAVFKNNEHEENIHQLHKSSRRSKHLSNDEVVGQCLVFLLSGYESTSSALSFTVYELALNPDVQDRLTAEIDGALKAKGRLEYEDILEMKYLDRVVCETLRKYGPATRTTRVPSEDYHIKSHNITIPKGMVVGIPIYAIHHDSDHYPDPEKYDPDRFSPEQKATRHPYTYLPFGAGPRNCVAMRFALMSIKICLAYVLGQCRFSVCPETKVPPEFLTCSSLLQPKEIMLKVEMRNSD